MVQVANVTLEQSGTFWATIAQIAGVFAIPLVIEARRSVSKWKEYSTAQRRWTAALFYGAGFLILSLINNSLGKIAYPSSNRVDVVLALLGVAVLASILMFQPVTNYFMLANADVVEILNRWLPRSAWRARRKEYRKFRVMVVDILGSIERLEIQLGELEEMQRKSKVIDGIATKLRTSGIDLEAHWGDPAFQSELSHLSDDQRVEIHDYIVNGSNPLTKVVKRQIRRTRRTIRKYEDLVASGIDWLEEVKGAEKITFISPELARIFETNAHRAADDARDHRPIAAEASAFQSEVKAIDDEAKAVMDETSSHPGPQS